jgi:hypothetical protein
VAACGNIVYAAGAFSGIGPYGNSHSYVAALDGKTGDVLPWEPNPNYYVSSIAVSGSMVYAGGNFTRIGKGMSHPYFAQFDSSFHSPVIRPASPLSGANKTGLQIINLRGSNFRSGAVVSFVYALSKSEHVYLRLYTIKGQLQNELVNKNLEAGKYTLNMQSGKLAEGIYLVAFKAGDFHQEKAVSLMK